MAIYRADTCTDIKKENLVAANDDCYGSPGELMASLESVGVTPGEKYFVQIDGSAGGAKGVFSLRYYAYPMNQEDIEFSGDAQLKIWPNPGTGIFNIRLEDAFSREVEIMVHDLNGKLVMQKEFNGVSGSLHTRIDLAGRAAGIYHLRVVDGDRILDRKLVKK